jgi:hypothetical protein
MLVRAKLVLQREGGCDREGEVFHVLVNPRRTEVDDPVRLTCLALEVLQREAKQGSSEDVRGLLLALRKCLWERIGKTSREATPGVRQAAGGGAACSCVLSDRCALRVGNAKQVPSRDPASRVVCGSALFCVDDAEMDSGLPVVHVQRTQGEGATLSLFAVLVRAPGSWEAAARPEAVAKHAESVMHFVRSGAGPCVNLKTLRLGRRGSCSIVRTPFQSHFQSREQLAESHRAELRNLGLTCSEVQHSITPLWTASQSVTEHGGCRVALLSLRI